MEKNLGYGKGNNFGIKINYRLCFYFKLDTIFHNNFQKIYREKNLKIFIAAPLEENDNNNYSFEKNGIADVEYVKGFAMF